MPETYHFNIIMVEFWVKTDARGKKGCTIEEAKLNVLRQQSTIIVIKNEHGYTIHQPDLQKKNMEESNINSNTVIPEEMGEQIKYFKEFPKIKSGGYLNQLKFISSNKYKFKQYLEYTENIEDGQKYFKVTDWKYLRLKYYLDA